MVPAECAQCREHNFLVGIAALTWNECSVYLNAEPEKQNAIDTRARKREFFFRLILYGFLIKVLFHLIKISCCCCCAKYCKRSVYVLDKEVTYT